MSETTRIPDWYAADASRCLAHVWRQGVDNEQMARTYRAYLAGAPTEPEPPRSEPTGWPTGTTLSWPRQQGRGT